MSPALQCFYDAVSTILYYVCCTMYGNLAVRSVYSFLPVFRSDSFPETLKPWIPKYEINVV